MSRDELDKVWVAIQNITGRLDELEKWSHEPKETVAPHRVTRLEQRVSDLESNPRNARIR